MTQSDTPGGKRRRIQHFDEEIHSGQVKGLQRVLVLRPGQRARAAEIEEAIRRAWEAGASAEEIAEVIGVDATTVREMVTG